MTGLGGELVGWRGPKESPYQHLILKGQKSESKAEKHFYLTYCFVSNYCESINYRFFWMSVHFHVSGGWKRDFSGVMVEMVRKKKPHLLN